MRRLTLTLLLCSPIVLAAQDPVQDQLAIANRLAAKVQRSEVWTDEQGNVTGLIFINHQALTNSVGPRPGINNEDLRSLIHFPKLTAINLEAQPIGDEGISVLRKFPKLKQIGFHYMAKAKGSTASPEFISVIDTMRDLEILEIKHNFRMESINVAKLKGPFPKVWRLVLDTPLNAAQTMHLIRLCPNVTDLQLHRTEVSADQLFEIGRIAPRIEVLWLKPKRKLEADHLRSLRTFSRLRIFSPQHFKDSIAYESGWDALAELPELERLEIGKQESQKNEKAIERLKRQRPGLVVTPTLTRSRNYDGL